MNIEESLTDLPTPNFPETPTLKLRKSNISREQIYNVINVITNTLETVHYDLKEVKQKSMETFQETYNFIVD